MTRNTLKILAALLGFVVMPVLASAQQQVYQGGTGLDTIPAGYILRGNNDFTLTALGGSSAGQVLSWDGSQWVAGSAGAGSVTSVGLTVPTGLTVSGSPVTSAGTLTVSLTSGYVIPLTASTTNWNSFYDTPSTRITAGSSCSWAGNTFNCPGAFSYPFPSSATSSPLTLSGLLTISNSSTTLASFGYASSTVWRGGGLSADCDTAATSKLLWDITTGQFSCGTDQNTGSSFAYPFPNNATTTALGLYASTTIGAGGVTTGLTVSGGATTTGNLIAQGGISLPGSAFTQTGSSVFSSTNIATAFSTSLFDVSAPTVTFSGGAKVGIGSSTPGTALGVNGDAVIAGAVTGRVFNATSTVGPSTFPYASSTAMTAVTAWITNLFIGADTLAEYIADTAGAMFTGNTETDITVTYDDADNTVDFVVDTLPNLTGTLDVDSGGTGSTTLGGLLSGNGTSVYSSATTSATCSTGVSCAAHTVIGNSAVTITNTGVTSLAGTANQLTASAATGAVILSLPNHVIFPGNFQATNSTTTNATTTALDITGLLTFNGVTGNSWDDFCTAITGGAGLCDGTDASGGGGVWPFTPSTFGGVANQSTTTNLYLPAATIIASSSLVDNATTTNATTTNLYASGQTRLGSLSGVLVGSTGVVGTGVDGTDFTLLNAITCSNQALTAFTAAGVGTCSSITDSFISGTIGVAHGGTASSSLGGILAGGGTSVYSVATSSASCGTGISCSAFTVVGSVSPSIVNTGVTSLAGTANQLNASASTGAIVLSLPNHVIFPGNFQATSASTTNATSTHFAVTGGLYDTNGSRGSSAEILSSTGTAVDWITCAVLTGSAGLCDGDDATGGAGGAWPFTPSTYAGTAVQSTSTPLWITAITPFSLIASSTFATNASSTQLTNSGSTWLPTLTSALVLANSAGLLTEYTGIDCTNQFVRDVGADGAGTCATVGTADVSGLDISDDTNLTAGDALTITGDDIDFDGGTVPTGDLGGTWGSPTVTDNSHAHDATTISGLGTADISGLDVSDDLNLTAGDCITLTADDLDVDDCFLLNNGDIGTGVFDFGGATSLEIPNGTGPTINAVGQIALDTSSGNLILATSTDATSVVIGGATTTLYAFSIASSSPDFLSGGIQYLPAHFLQQHAIAIICQVDAGTSQVINLSNEAGSSDTNAITCTTTSTQYTFTTNRTFNAYAVPRLEFGTKTGTPDYLHIRIIGYRTAN